MSYSDKQKMMEVLFKQYEVTGYACTYKNVPIALYEEYKQFIDFTAYYGVFRGKRNFRYRQNRVTGKLYKDYDSSTRKCNAVRVDLYKNDEHGTMWNRVVRQAFLKGVAYGKASV